MRAIRLLCATVLGGCAITHPPLVAPSAVIPRVLDLPPVGVDRGRLVLDANGEAARITADGTTICASTPCAAALPRGRHRLTFFANPDSSRYGDVDVDVTASPTIVRHALGLRHESPGLRVASIVAFAVGGSLAGLGAAVASPGLIDEANRTTWYTAGGSLGAAGLVGIAVGVSFALASRPHVWPGATRTWVVPSAAP